MRVRLLTLVLLAVTAAGLHADIKGTYRVMGVVGPDTVKLAFHGLPIVVRLAHVKAQPDAKDLLVTMLSDQEVAIRWAKELGNDANGLPYVNMAYGPPLDRKIANVELVAAGAADYDTTRARSKSYDKQLSAALKSAKSAKKGIWKAGTQAVAEAKPKSAVVPPEVAAKVAVTMIKGVLAEINATFYHDPGCPFARRLSQRNIVKYATPAQAERAGKEPCRRCQKERARLLKEKKAAAESGVQKWPGKLIGLKSDTTYFYSPVSPQLKKVSADDMIGFNTLAEAKASGRKPDPISLRLTSLPGYPAEPPVGDECIGRALPFFRPCRRDKADASGLCEYCQRGE